MTSSSPQRPGTVTAAGVILLVSGGIGILACGGLTYLAGEVGLADADRTVLTVVSAILLATSALTAALGYFVLRGRQWARVGAIVLAALGITAAVIGFFTGYDNVLGSCVGTVLNLVLIGLLSGASANDYFRYARR